MGSQPKDRAPASNVGKPRAASGMRMVVPAAVFAAVMAALTFLDLPIAKAVYHYNDLYGRIFQIIGLIPTCIAGIFFSVSNLSTRRIARRRIASAILSVLSILFFSALRCSPSPIWTVPG